MHTNVYYVNMGNSLFLWSSSKQKVVSHSSTEAKFRALAHLVAQVIWVWKVLKEL